MLKYYLHCQFKKYLQARDESLTLQRRSKSCHIVASFSLNSHTLFSKLNSQLVAILNEEEIS